MNFDLVNNRKWLFLGSGLMVVIALILLAIPPTLRPGIEFTSGTTTLLHFDKPVSQEQLRSVYAELGHSEARIQSTGDREYLIRTKELQVPPGSFTEVAPAPQNDVTPIGPAPATVLGTVTIGADGATGAVTLHALSTSDACSFGDATGDVDAGTQAQVIEINSTCSGGDVYRVIAGDVAGYLPASDTHGFAAAQAEQPKPDQGERTTIENKLKEAFGDFAVLEFATVSPTVSDVAVRNAGIAVGVAVLFILGYLTFAFASVPSPFRYGTCAVIALAHDVIVTLGFFSLFGKLFGTEIDLMFVTGLLTVIGFSVHDSIVVFDRIRENIRLSPNAPLHQNVNAALLQTLARSLNTSLTVLITVLAMLLLGGVTIRPFLLVILVGITAGAYSSIGIASQLLVSWEEGDFGRLAFWRRRSAPVGDSAN